MRTGSSLNGAESNLADFLVSYQSEVITRTSLLPPLAKSAVTSFLIKTREVPFQGKNLSAGTPAIQSHRSCRHHAHIIACFTHWAEVTSTATESPPGSARQ